MTRLRFLETCWSLFLVTFALTTITYSQTNQPAQKQQAASPVTMTECEGTNNCAAWSFLGTQGNGKWPSGDEANLTVEQYDNDSVVIRRADSTGSSAGLTVVYRGSRHGDNVGGEYTSTWPGHWENKTGNWYATLAKAAPPLPSVIHFCGMYCKTLVLENGHYTSTADPGTSIWTFSRFTLDLVIIDRVDSNGFSAHYKGKIAPEGNRLINVVKGDRPFTDDWTPGADTMYDKHKFVWGTALNTLPGNGTPPGQQQQQPVVLAPILVAPRVCIPWFFTIICD